jgi:hypothetical protein
VDSQSPRFFFLTFYENVMFMEFQFACAPLVVRRGEFADGLGDTVQVIICNFPIRSMGAFIREVEKLGLRVVGA